MENKKKLDSRNPMDALAIIDNISNRFELKKAEWQILVNSLNTLRAYIEINSANKSIEKPKAKMTK